MTAVCTDRNTFQHFVNKKLPTLVILVASTSYLAVTNKKTVASILVLSNHSKVIAHLVCFCSSDMCTETWMTSCYNCLLKRYTYEMTCLLWNCYTESVPCCSLTCHSSYGFSIIPCHHMFAASYLVLTAEAFSSLNFLLGISIHNVPRVASN